MNRPAASRSSVALVLTAVLTAVLAAVPAGCSAPSDPADRGSAPGPPKRTRAVVEPAPARFTIVPDDYHVPYAGTAGDGRRFFLSEELFEPGGSSYVGLFLWTSDGTFDEVRVDEVRRPAGVPAGQAAPAGAKALVGARLAELGDYVLEPVEVEPFTRTVGGVTFGWKAGRYEDGTRYLSIEPGDFIAYYAPWDGLDYDT